MGTLSGGDVARRRRTDVDSLKRQLSGDLDWIVMKAIDKDQQQRYASASEFAADIDRYLKDEPVLASRPSTGYRIHKFVARHKGPVAATVAILMALIAGIVTTAWQAHVAQKEKLEAIRETRRVNENSELALARALAAEGALLANENGPKDELATLLGIESIRRKPLLESNMLLNGLVAILPQEHHDLQPPIPTGISARIAFSPDGKLMAVTHAKDVRIFDASNWRELWRFKNEQTVRDIQFNSDSRSLAVLSTSTGSPSLFVSPDHGSAIVLDVNTGSKLSQFAFHNRYPRAISLNSQRILGESSVDYTLGVFETKTGVELTRLKADLLIAFYGSLFSSDNRQIAVVGASRSQKKSLGPRF
jgi:hypothetical protein